MKRPSVTMGTFFEQNLRSFMNVNDDVKTIGFNLGMSANHDD